MTHRWIEVERNETHIKYRAEGREMFNADKIGNDAPTHDPPPGANEVQLGKRGFRCRLADRGDGRKVEDSSWLISGGDGLARHATYVPKDAVEFKVGDRVRVIKQKSEGDFLTLGEEREVVVGGCESFRDQPTITTVKLGQKASQGTLWGFLWQFELVERDEPPAPERAVTQQQAPCVECQVAFEVNEYSESGRCGYCNTRIELGHIIDCHDLKAPGMRAPATPRRDPRFDPRPGIDDTGGGSGPSWED